MRRKAYLDASIREEVLPMLRIVLAILRAQYLNYQTSHWQTRGPAYYGNHLLFQRLYESVQADIDALGEKLVGYFGIEAVDLEVSLDLIFEMVGRWCSHECPFRRGLTSEGELQDALSIVRNSWPEEHVPLPLGLDDWLAATANAHESNIYLLQQVLDAPASNWSAMMGHRASAPAAPSAEGEFYDNPRKRETREFAESGAPTNVPAVGKDFAKEHGDGKIMRQVNKTPPTPEEILEKQPGSEGASTLSRLVIKSEEPDIASAAKANRALMASWLREITSRR
jgi:hypothetical protein